MSVLLEFSMFPTNQGESVSDKVSQVISMIASSSVSYKLTAMGTIIETENVAEALAIVEQAASILDELGCRRIYASLKMDIRKGKSGRLGGKIDSIREKIGDVQT
jgi:uncharacterized protein (TIGR00106 family)